jgi:hypothetical protein
MAHEAKSWFSTPTPDIQDYQPVSGEASNQEPAAKKARRSSLRPIWIHFFLATVTLAFLTAASILMSDPRMPKTTPGVTNCGNSTQEAIARGCIFDRLTLRWLPKSCPRDMEDEFLAHAGPWGWTYWGDQGKSQILNQQELSYLGEEGRYWTTPEEHHAHCAFIIFRHYSIWERGGRMDSMASNVPHALALMLCLVQDRRPCEEVDSN